MASRIGRLGMVFLLVATVLVSSREQGAQTMAQSQAAATIIVSGLSKGQAASFREVRNLDGSFPHVRDLGRLANGQLSARIDAGSFIGAEPLMVSENERYAVPVRFVPVPADGRLIATYRHEFHVTHITWTHGLRASVSISPDPGWFPVGGLVRLVAHPPTGSKFLHWGVFGVGERVDVRTVTSTGLELKISIDRPIQVVAAFGA